MLDEPIVALDAEAEFDLFRGYVENAARVADRSSGVALLVSHRFSTVGMADLIVGRADGRVAEYGTHDDLIARGGQYAELYGLQAAATASLPAPGAGF